MNKDTDDTDDIPLAVVTAETPRLSVVWLVPVIAILVGMVFVYKDYQDQGPSISIQFRSAEGIVPKQTKIKYRDVVVGQVNEVEFTEDLSRVNVFAEISKSIEPQLTEATHFWVVRPRIELTGASGISTLLSGAYIAMDPGKGRESTTYFTGLEDPPLVFSDSVGTRYKLRAKALQGISVGAPVYFRQIKVGEVLRYKLAQDHEFVDIDVFIAAPHDAYIKKHTRFWNVSGIEMDLTAEGLSMELNSLSSLISGGVAFETPRTITDTGQAPPGTEFTLFPDQKQSRETAITITVSYLLYFDDSVRGLSVGAPVEFRGIRIGTVTDIALEQVVETGDIGIPVLISLEPERMPLADLAEPLDDVQREQQVRAFVEKMVENGLRARLQTGNMLTGQLIVDFDVFDDEEVRQVEYEASYPILPTRRGTIASITDALTRIVTRLDNLPLEEIGHHLEGSLAGLDELINDSDLKRTMRRLDTALDDLSVLLGTLNEKAPPLLETVEGIGGDAEDLISQAKRTLVAFENLASEDGVVGSELSRTLQELAAAARSIRLMTEYLERHPEALIQGKR